MRRNGAKGHGEIYIAQDRATKRGEKKDRANGKHKGAKQKKEQGLTAKAKEKGPGKKKAAPMKERGKGHEGVFRAVCEPATYGS